MKIQNAKEFLKILIIKENLSITKLAKMLTEKTGKKVYQQSISSKLTKGTLKFDEMITICDLLGYEITFSRVEK